MAVIGINPSSRRPQAERQKQDPFDRDLGRVLKGLQVAGAGLQIMNELTTSEEEQLKIDTQKAQLAGMPTAEESQRTRAADSALKEAQAKQFGQTKSFDLAKENRAIAKHNSEMSRKKYQNEREMRQDVQRDPRRLANNKRSEFINLVKATHDKFLDDPNSISPLDQATLIESYKKAIDPGSAVMGGEFDTIQQRTIGFLDELLAKKDRVTGGVILTETQMKQLFNNVSLIDQVNAKNNELMNNFWIANAKANKIDPSRVIDIQQTRAPISEVKTDNKQPKTKLTDDQLNDEFNRLMGGGK